MNVLFFDQMIAKLTEHQMLKFVRKVIGDLNNNIIAEIQPLDNHYLILIIEQYQQLIMRTVIILHNDLLLCIILSPQKGELVPFAKMRLKVP